MGITENMAVLARSASTVPTSTPTPTPPPKKNLLVNPFFQIIQEHPSGVTGIGNAVFPFDQWRTFSGNTSAVIDVTQDTTGIFEEFGTKYAAKFDVTTADASIAASDHFVIGQKIEAQNLQHLKFGTANAVELTTQFAWQGPKSGTHCCALYNAQSNRSITGTFEVTAANTPEIVTATFIGDTGGSAIPLSTTDGMHLYIPIIAGSNYQVAAGTWTASQKFATADQQNLADNAANNIYIGMVELVDGDTANGDYYFPDFEDDLRDCKRHWQKSYDYAVAPGTNGAAGGIYQAYNPICGAGVRVRHSWDLSVPMRATGSVTKYDTLGASGKFSILTGGGGTQSHGWHRCYCGASSAKTMFAYKDDSHQGMPSAYGYVGHWTNNARM